MSFYRYQFCDLVTDRPIAELDLGGVRFDRRICQAGAFSGSIPITGPERAEKVAKVAGRRDSDLTSGPGRTVVHVWRGDRIWGTYLIWSAEPKADAQGRVTVDLNGASLESYFHHREIRADTTFIDVDQLRIARTLVQRMEAARPIGLVNVDSHESGVTRDAVYLASEALTYGDALEDLSSHEEGPEWMVRTVLRGNERVREFVVAQRLGQGRTEHVFTQPGNVLGWSYSADATDAATSWQTRGDAPETDPEEEAEQVLSRTWSDPRFDENGWPLLERTVDVQGVTDRATLDGHARWWARRSSGAVRFPQVSVRLDEQSTFTPDHLGDRARLTLVNDWFPLVNGRPSFSESQRIIGVEVTPATRGQGQDTATLIFEEPTDTDPGTEETG